MPLKYTKIYYENLKAFNDKVDLIVNQGGQGSSKTISILQVLKDIWITIPNLRITVAAYALPHLKAGAINDFRNILRDSNMNPDLYYARSEYTFYYPNKSYIEFVGIEGNLAKATGPRRDILYVNEANKRISYEVFELMNARTHLTTFIDFNPSSSFWFHEEIQPNFSHRLIKSTYIDNPYLPDREKRNLLSKKDNPKYANWWKVYGLGELGQLEGAILTNWEYGLFDDSLPFGYGIDFGVKHHDAMVKAAIDKVNQKIYWHEEIYENGLSTDSLTRLVKSKVVRNKLIVGDSSALRTINDLKASGLNIKSVHKDRITEDIKKLMGFDIIVTSESINLAHNLDNWLWLDKKGEIPMDTEDDLIDAGRYYTCPFLKSQEKKGHRLL
jgi:phage terminase large subunit